MATGEHEEVRMLVVRILASAGIDAQAGWVSCPTEDGRGLTCVLETRVARDGEVHLLHHAVRERPGDDDAYRIAARTSGQHPPGMTTADLSALRRAWGHALRRDAPALVGIDARGYVCARIPIAPLDMAGRMHERICEMRAGSSPEAEDASVRDLDRGRRGPRGVPRAPTVGAALAAALRTMPDASERISVMMPTVMLAVDDVARGGRDPVSIVQVSGGDGTLPWTYRNMRFEAKDWRFPGGSLTGRELRLDQALPETMMAAAVGCALGEIVSDPPLDPTMVVTRAARRRTGIMGTTLTLGGDPVPLVALARDHRAGD